VVITDNFSFAMLPNRKKGVHEIWVTHLDEEDVVYHLGRNFKSAVSNTGMARLFSTILGMDIPVQQKPLKFVEPLIVGQYIGPQLPEGATKLPPRATLDWFFVEVRY